MIRNRETGEINPLLIPLIIAVVLVLGIGGFAGWAYINYTDQKNNVDQKIEVAVTKAKQEQSDEDDKKFAEREKEPYRQFIGPEDLGRVQFDYPKTWSSYIAKTTSSAFEAYFQPVTVPPIDGKALFALRVTIESRSYDDAINSIYQPKVKSGELRSSPITVEGFSGVRFDGKFSSEVPNGAMVIFKVRDKTMRIYTEDPARLNDFNEIILKNLKFNP